jgi:hypothetical protein
MYSIYNLFKLASSTRFSNLALFLKEATDRIDKPPRERSPEVMERYLRRSLNRNPNNSVIKDLVERFHGATESEQVDIANEISNMIFIGFAKVINFTIMLIVKYLKVKFVN